MKRIIGNTVTFVTAGLLATVALAANDRSRPAGAGTDAVVQTASITNGLADDMDMQNLRVFGTDADGLAAITQPSSATSAPGCGATESGILGTCVNPNCQTWTAGGTRPFRDGVIGNCNNTPKNCPGASAGLPPFRYNSYQYDVPADCTCVSVAYNTGTCNTVQLFGVAYLGAIAPFATTYPADCLASSQGLRILGDTGGSPIAPAAAFPWAFTLPALTVPGPHTISLLFGSVTGTVGGVPPSGCTFSYGLSCAPSIAGACLIRPVLQAVEAMEAKVDSIEAILTPPSSNCSLFHCRGKGD